MSANGSARRHVVALAVTDGLPTFELAVPCEVFGIDRPDIADPWYELRMCAAGPGPVRTAHGLVVPTPFGLDELLVADTVVVAACDPALTREPPAELLAAVRRAHELGRRIVSLCAGVYIVAAAGLLSGRRATTHWLYAEDFARRFPDVRVDPAPLYVDHGDVLTSAGTGSVIDLCLHLVRADLGAAAANEVARRMVVPPHREGGQAQFARRPRRVSAAVTGGGAGLGPVLDWARARLEQPLTVAELARAAGLGERTFARRFRETLGTTPLQWLLQERVRLAQELLETTDAPIEAVAHRTGFGTAPNLRHHFRRLAGVAPATYREVFRHRAGRPRGAAATRRSA
ncbi:helix-turn-helix domain-containing protein [Streptomyces millisiae]|uniref:Helix-turn-helix domain-containing protein n=1 Tax=Streptomyces millisiae TaxID=3075542 RepID=A0ABU2LX82_9ACTN|nr:helix-turn-helix domain-containing protein [Streptomyces sp. DSM 44918]MDT0322211.1 helix-turn-helix domain-containing protein [Streptomyces sp. DSM 44918]